MPDESNRQTRKDNGDGTVYYNERRDRWLVRIQEGNKSDGRPNIVQHNARTEADAKRWLKEYKRSRGKFTSSGASQLTCEEFYRNWLYEVKRPTLKPSSFDRLERTVLSNIVPECGKKQLKKLSETDIRSHISRLTTAGSSKSNVKKIYDAYKAGLGYAVAKRLLDRNPCDLVNMPNNDNYVSRDIRFLDSRECEALTKEARRTYCTGTRVYSYGEVVPLLLNTGLRAGELAGLKTSDYDKEARELRITRNLQSVIARDKNNPSVSLGYVMREQSTKTYSGTRIVPLNDEAMHCMDYLVENNPYGTYLIETRNGSPVSHAILLRMVNHICDNAGVVRCSLHEFRHTFASMVVKNGADVKVLSLILGHSSVKTTYDIYIHLFKEDKHDAVKGLTLKSVTG